jgi:beta-fructofuranosidase
MAFSSQGQWIWDFWFAEDGETTHVFYLQADKALGDPELRHWHVSIGHAVSTDLVNWGEVGTALVPSRGPAFDDGTVWTGSILRHDSQWWMFYTGNSIADDNKCQRIGLATSPDLSTWTKYAGNPVLDLPEGYEEYDPSRWHDRSLRDPYVFPDPSGHGWRMLFTARVADRGPSSSGVIGQAWSANLLNWKAMSPLIAPGISGELEVPQYLKLNGRHYVLFCTGANRFSKEFRASFGDLPAHGGTHYFLADHPDGPWRLGPLPFLAGDARGSTYAGRILPRPDGQLLFFAFLNKDADGNFVGTLSDPVPLIVHEDGRLELARSPA